ncbi:hypothetical protein D030_0074B, partial [Vibrio parahaemolyticus AQ3810]
IRLFDTDIL